MYKINFNQPIHIHFIGIGGISMSGLAEILLEEHFTVSGSDAKESDLTRHLEHMGVQIFYGQKAENIIDGIDLVVYTAAISETNPEFARAKEVGLPMLSRAELLGQIMDNYKQSIAVAGTHGKTTTTSMISQILLQAKCDPTISVGGILKAIDGNLRVGKSDVFITEACEYTNSFLNFRPKYSIILNVEAEHLDFFKDIQDIRHSFHLFAKNTLENGAIIINGDIEHYEELVKDLAPAILTFGKTASSDFYPENITFNEKACATYDAMFRGEKLMTVSLNVPGMHNVTNSLAAIALAKDLKISDESILAGLSAFGGADRRFQYKGCVDGVTIIDDYAHHPTEIRATLTAAEKYPHKRLVLVFQPHTYSRTKAFLDDFADVLSMADVVVLADIYAAREKNTIGISSKDILTKLEEKGTECYYFPSFSEIENFLLENCVNGDLLITMGAGDIVNVGESLLGK
ncbi:MAG: UDP-N-acetylmuramate--L-alanine ligase [Roseburia sp.]|uniref:UDP-N-acetylmuramate--L-alanine ligase n=1 Tax=Roseburia sp. 831b TaxID=1261635 RepID=UPI0009525B9C|nr:UDP-N-acetylmuramate--L-alanine ligase [Roseburia sp. 831b]MCI5918998.1 UDP-N-acetylmuramate--L-alanine ligase [Roseburia sp.]MDD6215200.1 UDP-N-acetylmuramate--L-alanine ligase [Roseburia sp.]MDY5882744.1 UDP-N-acetylmuramate--L-alanine ligase [Roseburia sp.]WVK72351.1 UDP-N-acetylmuramate--L-alanine ligase [Roseburia sp. 831b]